MGRKQNEDFRMCYSTYCIPIDNVNILWKASVDMLWCIKIEEVAKVMVKINAYIEKKQNELT